MNQPARIVLTTFGSFGDLHPYLALGLELQARGHQAVVATSETYRDKVLAEGLSFHPVRPDLPPPDEAPALIARVMDARDGTRYLLEEVLLPQLRDSYHDLSEAAAGADLLVTHPVTFAGPLVAQKQGLPWVSTVLSPISFFSAHDLPVPPSVPLAGLLRSLGPAVGAIAVRFVNWKLRPWFAPIAQFRQELGLAPEPNIMIDGAHSPALVLAMFSRVLASPQPDWPPQARVTGFSFYDRREQEQALPPQLETFLQVGAPPIVFTLGSAAVMDPGDFYHASLAAAVKLGRRAVLLTGDALPLAGTPLPPDVLAVPYAPYSMLLPRAAAVVHQGGIGTTGQSLRAGIPMLIMPYTHDQPDNAARITRLGAGRTVPRHRYNAANAARELNLLLSDSSYPGRADVLGRMVRRENGAAEAAEAVAAMLR